jgi:DNA-binding transcriptional LysR family regulator
LIGNNYEYIPPAIKIFPSLVAARAFCPTPFGHQVLTLENRILDDVQKIEVSALQDRGVEGPFHLGVISTVAPYLLPTAIHLIQESPVRP